MASLTFDPVPELTIDGEVYHGINIVEVLYEKSKTDPSMLDLLIQAVAYHTNPHIPRLGFFMEDERAVVPTKRCIDVGYDITIIDVAKQLTPSTTMYETGVSLDIPLGYYVEMIPRSSLSKSGYMFANSIGVIDPCYTGTLKVALVKVDNQVPDIELPSRVAQIILKPYVFSTSMVSYGKNKNKTKRGTGGFGST